MIEFFDSPDAVGESGGESCSEPSYESPEIQVLRGALDSYTDRFGPHHPLVLEVVEGLAMAWWREGEIGRAIDLLERTITLLPETAHSSRADLLDLVWKIFFEQRQFDVACRILEEVLACRVRAGGPVHPAALAAQGDLAIVLYEMGRVREAEAIGHNALDEARAHLGTTDPVTALIAWNALFAAERRGDPEGARRIAVENLLWILSKEPVELDADLREIRAWLEDRFTWDSAPVC